MQASSVRPSAPPASRTTTELYRSCMNLSEEARSLLVQNDGMKRLGLNAQVLAAQSGSQGAALEVIVSDIVRLSQAIRNVLEGLDAAAKSLSQASIEVLHLSLLDAAYAKGAARGIAPQAAALYRQTHTGVRTREGRLRQDLKSRLKAVSIQVEDLGRIAQQILPVTTMIRIVAGEATTKEGELLGAVDELKSFHGHLDSKVEQMRQIHGDCVIHLEAMGKEDR